MKLYEVPRRTWVRVKEEDCVPPGALNAGVGMLIFFDHLDGMYSYCKDKDGNLMHLAAWTEVEVVHDPSSIGR